MAIVIKRSSTTQTIKKSDEISTYKRTIQAVPIALSTENISVPIILVEVKGGD